MALAAAPDNVVILSHYGRVLKLQRNFSGYNFYFFFLFLLHYGRNLKLQQTLSGVQKSDDSDFTQYLF